LPIAIIQNGTKANEIKVVGSIDTISELVKRHQLSSPAIIIIGEVVKNAANLNQFLQEAQSEEDEFVFQNLNINEGLL
jgi:uroporphyrin-III C-methyltransferase